MTKKSCVSHLVVSTAGCVLFVSASPATAGMGDMVSTFGGTGVVTVAGNAGTSVFELADGRIVVAGQSYSSAVAVNRFLANGLPDLSFGTGGLQVVDLPGIQQITLDSAALQPDEKLVIGGSYWVAKQGRYPYAARLNVDGTVDPTFHGGVTTLSGATEPMYTSALVMPSAEILLAISDWTSDRIDRYAPDGRYLGNLSAAVAPLRLAMQGDGRVIVAGYHRDLHQPVVMRIDARGQRDQTFGTEGYARVTVGYEDLMAIEPGGDRILLCGPSGVARLTPDGHPDTTFGADGTGYVAFGSGVVPSFQVCEGLLPLQGGGLAYAAGRYAVDATGAAAVYVGGLTETGAVDTRFGAGQGFRAIAFGGVYLGSEWWDIRASFVATRDGNALLTSLSYPIAAEQASAGLLAKIDLGGESLIATMPTDSAPNPTPTPTPTPHGSSGDGGGGAVAGLDVGLLLLLATAGIAPRKLRRDGRPNR